MSDLPVLPDVSFAQRDPQAVIDNVIGTYEQLTGRTLAEGDPVRLFLLAICYVIINERANVDRAGKNNLLYYATGDYLDHLGALRLAPRIPAEPARTTIRYTLSAARPVPVQIPQGNRTTPDNRLFFSTVAPATIQAGSLFVDVVAECLTPGIEGNGLQPGDISVIVDPIPFVSNAQNLTVTAGGRAREDDESYRERIYNAPGGFSVAGPEAAYIYFTQSVSAAITSVVAYSPSPATVRVHVLVDDGQLPPPELNAAILDRLSAYDVRPLTDLVEVTNPTVVDYDINLTYFINEKSQADADRIALQVAEAVDGYKRWQRAKLGRDINPSELISRIMQVQGVKRVAITGPVFTTIDVGEVAHAVTTTIVDGGPELE